MTFRFPSDSPASQARLARAIEKERAARMPKTTRGTPFEEHLRAIGHPAVPPKFRDVPYLDDDGPQTQHPSATPQSPPRAQEQAALVAGQLCHFSDKGGDSRSDWTRARLYVGHDGCGLYQDKYFSWEFAVQAKAGAKEGDPYEPPTPAERAQSGGWIEWSGGECPVPADTLIEYKIARKDGAELNVKTGYANPGWRWQHLANGRNIVAYRLIQP